LTPALLPAPLLLILLLLMPWYYFSGDHLEVLPRNAPALVDAALQLLQLNGQEPIWWTPNSQGAARGLTSVHPTANSAHPSTSSNASSAAAAGDVDESATNPAEPVLRLPLSSRDVLAWLVDLSAVPPMRMVATLAAECPCPPEAAQLKRMATEAVYREEVSTLLLCAHA
jgi:sulfite reductase alpha subunit-like flavoprotein